MKRYQIEIHGAQSGNVYALVVDEDGETVFHKTGIPIYIYENTKIFTTHHGALANRIVQAYVESRRRSGM